MPDLNSETWRVLIAAAAFTVLQTLWGAAAELTVSSVRLDIGIASVYDNNILRYSDKYITRFNNREDPGRFHISTLDDLIWSNALKLSATLRFIGSLNTTAAMDFRQRRYITNSVKNWSYLAFSMRQDFSKRLAVQVAYSYIPEFYVRHFRDEDWTALYGFRDPIVYQPFSFQKDELVGWVQYVLSTTTRLRGSLGYARYFHNKHFTEYDCRNTEVGLAVYQNISNRLRVRLGFDLVYSRGDGNARMDPSNGQNIYSVEIEYQLPVVFDRTNSVGVSAEHTRSGYLSKRFLELDPNHAGREDMTYEIGCSYTLDVLDNLNLILSYTWRERDTRTSALANAEYLSAEKDYRQYQIGLEVKYTMKLK